jgi:hypothetical protein
MLIETSHLTIQGLRILGLPVVESPRAGLIKRLYAISRLRRDLEDLKIAQCLFAGEELTNPNHVGIIANGNNGAVVAGGDQVSRRGGTGRGDSPVEGTGGQAGYLVEQALDGKTPSGVGEPTCTPCDRRGFYNGENARRR